MQYSRIRDLREDHDLYQKDLAEYLHCSQVTDSRLSVGQNRHKTPYPKPNQSQNPVS